MPTRRLDRSKTAEQVSDELGGLMTPNGLLKRARKGLVPGAFKVGDRVWFAPNTASWLLVDLSTAGGAGLAINVPKEGSTVDGYYKPS